MPRLLYRLPANAVSRRETSGEGPKSQSFTTLTSYDTTVLAALTKMEQHIAPSNSELRDPPLPRSPSTGIGDEYKIPFPASTSFSVLKDRIKQHYEICSDYYYSLW